MIQKPSQLPSKETILDALEKTYTISITDAAGNILYINDKFCELSKYSREELIGKNHRILKSGFHSPEFYQNT